MKSTIIHQRLRETRSLADAYTEILLDAVKAEPSFGAVVLCRDLESDSPHALHRGTVLACEVLNRTSCPESTESLRQSLCELYEAPWLSLAHVQGLLRLAARPDDHALAAAEARCIAIGPDGIPTLEAYKCRLTLQGDWWVIDSPQDQHCYRCLQLSTALHHAELIHLNSFPRSATKAHP